MLPERDEHGRHRRGREDRAAGAARAGDSAGHQGQGHGPDVDREQERLARIEQRRAPAVIEREAVERQGKDGLGQARGMDAPVRAHVEGKVPPVGARRHVQGRQPQARGQSQREHAGARRQQRQPSERHRPRFAPGAKGHVAESQGSGHGRHVGGAGEDLAGVPPYRRQSVTPRRFMVARMTRIA